MDHEKQFFFKETAVGRGQYFAVGVKIKFCLLIFILCTKFASTSLAQQNTATRETGKLDTVSAEPVGKSKATRLDSSENTSLATFPGGDKEYMRYLQRNISLPPYYTVKSNTTITVTFTIDESGKLKNLQASDGPKPLQKEAIKVVKNSGRWIPAYRDQKPIASERQQRISFFVSE